MSQEHFPASPPVSAVGARALAELCRREGATPAAAAVVTLARAHRAHTAPARGTPAPAHPPAWPQPCPLGPSVSLLGGFWCLGCSGTRPGVPQLWDAAGLGLIDPLVQESSSVLCSPPGVTDIPPWGGTVGFSGWQQRQSHRGTRGFPPLLSSPGAGYRHRETCRPLGTLDVTAQPERGGPALGGDKAPAGRSEPQVPLSPRCPRWEER